MSITDDTNAARRGSGSNDQLGPTVADVFAKMRTHRPDWNAYGQSRESAADLACRCAIELAADHTARAVAAERERWERPAFLWPAAMPDEVARWLSANPPQVLPRAEMQRVEWPNAELTGSQQHGQRQPRANW